MYFELVFQQYLRRKEPSDDKSLQYRNTFMKPDTTTKFGMILRKITEIKVKLKISPSLGEKKEV
jgi:hypothetical protein